MNILPKKRWHVRTKENIARVRKDEADAAEKERQENLRIQQADRELRLNILKIKSKENLKFLNISSNIQEPEGGSNLEHINLFADIEHAVSNTNKDHDREIKEKTEEYEKKIGYLTYLGQDTNEALGKKNWYEITPELSRFSRSAFVKDTYDKLVLKDEDGKPKKKDVDIKDWEIGWKSKQKHDPFNAFKHLCKKYKKKHDKEITSLTHPDKRTDISTSVIENKKKHKKKDKMSNKEIKLNKLREARLKREQQEKHRTEQFLTSLTGEKSSEPKNTEKTPKVIPKYNSQFNPELARQNYR